MNKMKLLLGVILLFVAGVLAGSLGAGLYFQQRVNRFEGPGPQVPVRVQILLGRFSAELNLTRPQRAKIEEIVNDSQEQILALGREMLPEIEEINEESWELVKDQLNDDQKKKLDELYQRVRGFQDMGPLQPSETRRRRSTGPVDGDMKSRLNLTEEQYEKLHAILEDRGKEREKIQEKYRGQDSQDFLSLGNELRELDEDFEKRIGEILTEEQMRKYKETEEGRTDRSSRMKEGGTPSSRGPDTGSPRGTPEGGMPRGTPEGGIPSSRGPDTGSPRGTSEGGMPPGAPDAGMLPGMQDSGPPPGAPQNMPEGGIPPEETRRRTPPI